MLNENDKEFINKINRISINNISMSKLNEEILNQFQNKLIKP
jgi:hypothetical protein